MFFKFKISINALISSFCFICIPMPWVYGNYKYFNASSVGTVFIRRNLTSTETCIKTVLALKGLSFSTPDSGLELNLWYLRKQFLSLRVFMFVIATSRFTRRLSRLKIYHEGGGGGGRALITATDATFSPLKALNHFCITHGNQRGLLNLKSS